MNGQTYWMIIHPQTKRHFHNGKVGSFPGAATNRDLASVDEASPRLFLTKQAAQISLKFWLKGFGARNNIWNNGNRKIEYTAIPARKAIEQELQIVPINLLIDLERM